LNLMKKTIPWGKEFLRRRNVEAGYKSEEGRLVKKYLQNPSFVLIIGSGNGREARPISRGGHKIVCLDYGYLYLSCGRKYFENEGICNIDYLQADMLTDLPIKDNTFEFVIFSMYSVCGARRFSVMRAIHRIMRTGGMLLLGCCTPIYPKLYPTSHDYINKEFTLIDSASQLEQEVSLCGFKLLESGICPARTEYRKAILEKIDGSPRLKYG